MRAVMRAAIRSAGARSRWSTISPSDRNRTRSAQAAAAGSWVTMTTVASWASTAWRRRERISAAVVVSRAPVGSSAKTTSGRVTRARAIATRCCWPPESWPGRRRALSVRPTWARTSAARRRSGRWPASRIGRTTFCSTVRDASRLNAWKTKPRRVRRSAVSLFSFMPVISVPPSRTVPAVGRSRPAAHCRKVDFPEPEGPMTAVKLPRERVRSMPRRACTALPPRP